jgi:hypothetical protein
VSTAHPAGSMASSTSAVDPGLDVRGARLAEAGRVRPYPVELARLARALDVEPKEAERPLDNVDTGPRDDAA